MRSSHCETTSASFASSNPPGGAARSDRILSDNSSGVRGILYCSSTALTTSVLCVLCCCSKLRSLCSGTAVVHVCGSTFTWEDASVVLVIIPFGWRFQGVDISCVKFCTLRRWVSKKRSHNILFKNKEKNKGISEHRRTDAFLTKTDPRSTSAAWLRTAERALGGQRYGLTTVHTYIFPDRLFDLFIFH